MTAAINTPFGPTQNSATAEADGDEEDFAVIRFGTASEARAALHSRLEAVDLALAED